MQTNYYSMTLLQQVLYLSNLRQIERLSCQISQLQTLIFSRQKKHRRCDKDLSKDFNCQHCDKMYASDVALKLHMKLKHNSENSSNKKENISRGVCEQDATPESI